MSRSVKRMYSDIYEHYDTVNALCSFGTMKLWRKVAAREAVKGRGHYILDIATGTGELAFEMMNAAHRRNALVHITGMDFNRSMLRIAKQKALRSRMQINLELGDATRLKYPNNSFDVVVSGFALKNIDDLHKFSKEVRRVLRKHGRFIFLEMARPDSKLGQVLIGAYWYAMGKAFALAGKGAYIGIIRSVNDFDKHKFMQILKEEGFKDVKASTPIFGPAFLITGKK